MAQQPYINLGCGRVILPAPAPGHYSLIAPGVTDYALWVNADRNMQPGVDRVVDLFSYPWPFEDNSFDGALLAHIAEHIPHQPDYGKQDGWYAFFAELWRVLTPGAVAHILSPYGWSQGAITDPTHTRLITEQTFTHSMAPDPHSPFEYATGGLHFEQVEPARFRITEMFTHLLDDPVELTRALQTRINVAYEIYVKLRAIK